MIIDIDNDVIFYTICCTCRSNCWMITNSDAIVYHQDTINDRLAGSDITTYDFTTLYTMLPPSDILDAMENVIDVAFKKSKYKYISVYEKSSSWSSKPHANTFKFDSCSL